MTQMWSHFDPILTWSDLFLDTAYSFLWLSPSKIDSSLHSFYVAVTSDVEFIS